MKQVILKVDGMTCQGCVNAVTRVLQRKGAQEVKVSLDEGRARFQVPDERDPAELAQAVTEAGYPAQVQEVQPL